MKFKVKGLVFVGFAAAILSANAYAEGENTVTSKAYTDATYAVKSTSTTKFQVGQKSSSDNSQTWADLDTKVTGVTDDYVSVGANATTGGVEVKMDANKMTTTYTNGTALSQSSTNLVTEAVVAKAIADSTSTASGNYQPKTQNKIQVATLGGANGDTPTWTGIDSAVQEATNGYVDISAADASTGVITFDIAANMINNTGAALATASSSDKHLVTDYTLTSELNKKQDQQLGVAGQGGADSTDYEKLVYIGTDGKIAKSSLKVVDTVANDNLNPVTSNAVYDYVGTTLTNLPIPATMPDACKAANAHCALVTSYANNTVTAEWTVMAQAPAQQQAGH